MTTTPDLSPWPVGPLLQGWAHERVCLLEAENARLLEALREIARLAGLMNRGLQPRIGMIADAAAAALRPTTTDTER